MKPTLTLALLCATSCLAALDVDLDSPDSIRTAARAVAKNLLTYYHGSEPGQTPGILPGPPPAGEYFWWEAGALWGTMIDYWHYTHDPTYNALTTSSLLFQTGPPQNAYMPPNWTASLGNDDQGFWGMSAMLAAETRFPDPPPGQPQWLELAQAVFNTQADHDRHDNECGGGLRWQIPLANAGYDYKNAIANGIFFNLGARLARYTGNATYADFATETWDWTRGVGILSPDYDVYDGGHTGDNCSDIYKAQFSYNAAVFMQGAAFMYNFTSSAQWRAHVLGLVNRTIDVFFQDGSAKEISCELEAIVQCKTDMLSFKGYLHRWMASTAQLAPFTHNLIAPVLRNSTAAAVRACEYVDVSKDSAKCGFRWNQDKFDGMIGAGQQMNVLAALSALLMDEEGIVPAARTNEGGTSRGDSAAGGRPAMKMESGIETADKAGAYILTVLAVLGLTMTTIWMGSDLNENVGGENKAKAVEESKAAQKATVDEGRATEETVAQQA